MSVAQIGLKLVIFFYLFVLVIMILQLYQTEEQWNYFLLFFKFIMFLERTSFESNKFTLRKPLKCIFYNCVRYYYLYY